MLFFVFTGIALVVSPDDNVRVRRAGGFMIYNQYYDLCTSDVLFVEFLAVHKDQWRCLTTTNTYRDNPRDCIMDTGRLKESRGLAVGP